MATLGRVRKIAVSAVASQPEYEEWNMAKLRKEIKRRGLAYRSTKKADLVQCLEDDDSRDGESVARESLREPDSVSETPGKRAEGKVKKVDWSRIHQEQRKARQRIVLWRHPLQTLVYFLKELQIEAVQAVRSILAHKITVAGVLVCLTVFFTTYYVEGPHQKYFSSVEKQILWCAYWVGLGILSSVGLGTGLHTFLLYLGPHIASVTLAAWSCMSLDFPEPPYPDKIRCPNETIGEDELNVAAISILAILNKVKVEAFMWGAGTAIGELPPYFMARAARLSGKEDEEFEELEEELHSKRGILNSAKLFMHNLVQRVGFLGILLAASIPNPLFDLAGITCGHFLVPFWTFFGATLIGKAVFKMLLQTLFCIVCFSKNEIEFVMYITKSIPYIGPIVEAPFEEFIDEQRQKYLTPKGDSQQMPHSILQWILEKLVMLMIAYFILSIVNSMAQAYAKRLDEEKNKSQAEYKTD